MLMFNFINIVVLSTVFILIMNYQKSILLSFKKSDAKHSALQLRNRFLAISKDENAWSSAIEDNCNSSLACQSNDAGADCFVSHANPNEWTEDKILQCIYDFEGKDVYFDYGKLNAGFDIRGEKCFTFDYFNSDGRCVFRPYIQWRSTCTKSPCNKDQIEFRIRIYQAGLGVPLNTSQLALIWSR